MTTIFNRPSSAPRSVCFNGSYGTLEVDASTGVVLAYHREEGEEPAYSDIVRVDLEERRAWYLARGIDLPDLQPDGDILDAACLTASGETIPAEDDYRAEIAMAVYGREEI